MTDLCQWFAMCFNTADGCLKHPILGLVPTCRRCAEHVGMLDELIPFEEDRPHE